MNKENKNQDILSDINNKLQNDDDDPNFRSHENDQKNSDSLSEEMNKQVDEVIQKLVAFAKKKKERELDNELGGTEVAYDKKKSSKKTGADINYEQNKSKKDVWDSRASEISDRANEDGAIAENTQNRSFQFHKKRAKLKAKKKAREIDREENAISYVEALKQQRQDNATKSHNNGGISF